MKDSAEFEPVSYEPWEQLAETMPSVAYWEPLATGDMGEDSK